MDHSITDKYLRENNYRPSGDGKRCEGCFYFFPVYIQKYRPGCLSSTVEVNPGYVCDRFRLNEEVNEKLGRGK
jgi:hypothetical protein